MYNFLSFQHADVAYLLLLGLAEENDVKPLPKSPLDIHSRKKRRRKECKGQEH